MECRGYVYVTTQNFVAVSLPILGITVLKMAVVLRLLFSKLEGLTADMILRASMHQRTKFRDDGSKHCPDMAIFLFSKWRPSAILDIYEFGILTADMVQRDVITPNIVENG